MSDFKLLAIRPLKGCSSIYRKLLRENCLYQFYLDYKFIFEDGDPEGSVAQIVPSQTIPSDLYSVETHNGKKININISAIVGKNGAGKSSIFELLYLSIFVIATKKGIIAATPEFFENQLSRNDLSAEQRSVCLDEQAQLEYIYNNLKVEIFYSFGDSFYCLQINSDTRQMLINETLKKKRNFQLKSLFSDLSLELDDFFYTIAINYSVYGLNSSQIGFWIDSLFHKNDGYQTPLVINPMRTEGNFDINIETHLSQSRVLANLAGPAMEARNVLSGKQIDALVFKVDPKKIETFRIISLENVIKKLENTYKETRYELFVKVYSVLTGDDSLNIDAKRQQVPHFEWIVHYTIKKLFKIADIYKEYSSYYEPSKDKLPIPSLKNLSEYLEALSRDKSHITLKLRQILNVVRFNIFTNDGLEWNNNEYFYPVHRFAERVRVILDSNSELTPLEIVPAAFYKPNLFVRGEGAFFYLSSGELQMVNSLQTIYYHLNYINSVFKSHTAGENKTRYKYINILLDEIELYFHPDFQRALVKELLDGITSLDIDGIDGINILFATHSPFILSDVCSSNILKIERGQIQPDRGEQTFGANIYDLLANDFYMRDGFIGAFAMDKIKLVLDYISAGIYSEDAHGKYVQISELISDDVIRIKLLQLLSAVNPNAKRGRLEVLRDKQRIIEDEIRKLESQ